MYDINMKLINRYCTDTSESVTDSTWMD